MCVRPCLESLCERFPIDLFLSETMSFSKFLQSGITEKRMVDTPPPLDLPYSTLATTLVDRGFFYVRA